jgi:hypothetical protein
LRDVCGDVLHRGAHLGAPGAFAGEGDLQEDGHRGLSSARRRL